MESPPLFEEVKSYEIGTPQGLDFYDAQILGITSVSTEAETFFVLIAREINLVSSVIVLDSQMNLKHLPGYYDVKISQLAQSVHEGHLFAFDVSNNLIAMNLNLLCHGDGFSPYEIMNYSEYAGGSVISVD